MAAGAHPHIRGYALVGIHKYYCISGASYSLQALYRCCRQFLEDAGDPAHYEANLSANDTGDEEGRQ